MPLGLGLANPSPNPNPNPNPKLVNLRGEELARAECREQRTRAREP